MDVLKNEFKKAVEQGAIEWLSVSNRWCSKASKKEDAKKTPYKARIPF
jgi:hypothetical protein